MELTLRPYEEADRSAVLNLFCQLVPGFFAEAEAQDLEAYLDQHREAYFVVEKGGMVVGAGGINYFSAQHLARLSWDFVHPDCQGMGIGRKLVEYRLAMLQANPAVQQVVVRTSQLVYPFYEKMGFALEMIQKDYWAPGFDLYQMRLSLRQP